MCKNKSMHVYKISFQILRLQYVFLSQVFCYCDDCITTRIYKMHNKKIKPRENYSANLYTHIEE